MKGRLEKLVTINYHYYYYLFLSTIFVIATNTILPFSELQEEINLVTFAKEDQEMLTRWGKELVSRVLEELRDYLQQECGKAEALPDHMFHDIMLQVSTVFLTLPP